MFDVAGHGGSVARSLRGFPFRTILCGVALVCGLMWWPPVTAGVLYQCTGSNGEAVYSSSKAGYHGCRAMSSYAAPALKPKAAPPPRVSLTGVSATVLTSARRLVAGSVESASLAQVRGTVETSATSIGATAAGKTSLASVQASVTTSAVAPQSVGPVAAPGQWSYRESHAPVAAAAAAEPLADKVLRGAVYRIVRADGSVEYTNLPQVGGGKGHAVTMLFTYIATCAACNLHSTVRWGSVSLNLTAYADTIRAASVEYGVDEAFLRAIIHAESAFNPRAMSLKGAQGLMQLMPGTAGDMGALPQSVAA